MQSPVVFEMKRKRVQPDAIIMRSTSLSFPSNTISKKNLSPQHTGIFKGCGYSSRLWLQFLKDVATVKNGRFAREFSGKSTTNAHFTDIILSMPI